MTQPIALDAMGGDYAPGEMVTGAVQAARDLGLSVVLVGRQPDIETELGKHDITGLNLTIHHAEEVIGMAEHPAAAVRSKKNSSITAGLQLVKEGIASGFVSAGNSGAIMAAALFVLGRLPGIERPGIGSVFPTESGKTFLIDIGAQADCKPLFLKQFAEMGAIYMERVFNVPRPRVGLLSIGEEATKGNQLVLETHALLDATELNFVGNVEGIDITRGSADVIVCDGFTGNVALKLAEGVSEFVANRLRQRIGESWRYKLAAGVLRPAFRAAFKDLDYAEYGAAALLGVDGLAMIGHGRSNAKAIRSALRVADQAIQNDLVQVLREGAYLRE